MELVDGILIIVSFLAGVFTYTIRDWNTRRRLTRALYSEIAKLYNNLKWAAETLETDISDTENNEAKDLGNLNMNLSFLRSNLKTYYYDYARNDPAIFIGIKERSSIELLYNEIAYVMEAINPLLSFLSQLDFGYSAKEKMRYILIPVNSVIKGIKRCFDDELININKNLLLEMAEPRFRPRLEELLGIKYRKKWYQFRGR